MSDFAHSRAGAVFSRVASHLLVVALLVCALSAGLMAGLLAACLGYLFCGVLQKVPLGSKRQLPAAAAAAGVIVTPLVGLGILALHAKGITASAFAQFPELLEQMAKTVLEVREKLPPSLAEHVPDEIVAVQGMLAEYLKGRASFMATAGQQFLGAALLAYVGLVVGALIRVASRADKPQPLAKEIRARASNFLAAFRQIVAAQFWIATFNAVCTAIFLFAVLPSFDVQVPYSASLVALTFFAGLVPIVGNLLCNGVLALVGTSVSPMVGLACLAFLIGIHKFEYFINAKVVGSRTNTSAWELLAVMFVAEALVGVVGLVAAPLYYAYAKRELRDAGLV